MKWMCWLTAIVVSGFAVNAPAEEAVSATPLDRFCENLSPAGLVTNLANEMAQTFPVDRRVEAAAAFVRYMDVDAVEQIIRREFGGICTPEELSALADVCSTATGRSALQKYMVGMERVMASLQPEFVKTRNRVLQEFKKQ